ncbi:hypothetical protein [Gemmobacter denitrificans]|uniref:Holin of 3TMs, for gene-transfer release n=1 Tax=Gemmobacter denitrificans TaxID=3123040 RepID=A0ABU8BQ10_9RHOB
MLPDPARLRRVAALLTEGLEDQPLPAKIDLLNRAIRPLAVLLVLCLPALAFVDPLRYGAGVAVLGLTPWPVWGLCAAVLALHFLTRPGPKAG